MSTKPNVGWHDGESRQRYLDAIDEKASQSRYLIQWVSRHYRDHIHLARMNYIWAPGVLRGTTHLHIRRIDKCMVFPSSLKVLLVDEYDTTVLEPNVECICYKASASSDTIDHPHWQWQPDGEPASNPRNKFVITEIKPSEEFRGMFYRLVPLVDLLSGGKYDITKIHHKLLKLTPSSLLPDSRYHPFFSRQAPSSLLTRSKDPLPTLGTYIPKPLRSREEERDYY